MDAQIAAQFLGALLQVAATIFAVYIALIIFIIQDRVLSSVFLKYKIVSSTFVIGCVTWIATIFSYIMEFHKLGLAEPYGEMDFLWNVVSFSLAIIAFLFSFWFLISYRKRIFTESMEEVTSKHKKRGKMEAMSENRKGKILVLAIACMCYSIPFVPFILTLYAKMPIYQEVDPAAINGVLTVSALIMGFSGFEMRQPESVQNINTVLSIFFGQVLILMVVSLTYFFSYVTFQHATLLTMTLAVTSLLLNVLGWLLILAVKAYWSEYHEKSNKSLK